MTILIGGLAYVVLEAADLGGLVERGEVVLVHHFGRCPWLFGWLRGLQAGIALGRTATVEHGPFPK